MIATEEITKMTPAQKPKTMELLWDSLSEAEDKIPSPAWHKAVVSDRLKKIRSGKAKFLTLRQVKRRLRA